MFKNRALQVSVVKKQENVTNVPAEKPFFHNPAEVYVLTTKIVKDVALTVGTVYASSKILNAATEIAVLAAKAKLK